MSFRNVDLELGAPRLRDLAVLLEALDTRLVEIFRGRLRNMYRVHYELAQPARDANATLLALVEVIARLPRGAARVWAAAPVRDFNIVVELARGERSIELPLSAAAVRAVVDVGGRIVLTAYRDDEKASAG